MRAVAPFSAERSPAALRAPLVAICPNATLVAISLGALVWIPVLKTLGALGFLAAGGLLMLRNPAATAAAFARFWYVFLLPLYCLASTFWSVYPGVTFRFSLQLLATVAIAVAAATRLSPATFHRVLFLVFFSIMAASLLSGNVRAFDGAWLGMFGSKNALAGASAMFLVLAVALALDRHAPGGLRLAAVVGVPMGLFLLAMAKSAGAAIIAAPVLVAVAVLVLARHLSGAQKMAAALIAVVLAALALVLFLSLREAIFAVLLDRTGKDVTLTGRTELWRIALSYIAERPFFGRGYQAFWVQSSASAEALWRMFGIAGRGGFHFHNTYLSNAVEIGLTGVALQVALLWGAMVATAIWAVRSHRAEAACLFALALMAVMSSVVEVQVFFQFSVTTVNVVAILVFGLRALTEPRR